MTKGILRWLKGGELPEEEIKVGDHVKCWRSDKENRDLGKIEDGWVVKGVGDYFVRLSTPDNTLEKVIDVDTFRIWQSAEVGTELSRTVRSFSDEEKSEFNKMLAVMENEHGKPIRKK